MAREADLNNVNEIVLPFCSQALAQALSKKIGKHRELHRNPVTGDWDVTSDFVPIGRTYDKVTEKEIQNFVRGLEKIAAKYPIIGSLYKFVTLGTEDGKVILMSGPHFWTANAEALQRESKDQIDQYFKE